MEEDALEVGYLRIGDTTQELVHVHTLTSCCSGYPFVVEYGTIACNQCGVNFTLIFLKIHILVESASMSIKQEYIVASRSHFCGNINDACKCFFAKQSKVRPIHSIIVTNFREISSIGEFKEYEIARFCKMSSEFYRFSVLVTYNDTHILFLEVGFHDFPCGFRLVISISSHGTIEDDGKTGCVTLCLWWNNWLVSAVILYWAGCDSHDQHHGYWQQIKKFLHCFGYFIIQLQI